MPRPRSRRTPPTGLAGPLPNGTRVRLVQDHPLIGVAGDEGVVVSGPDSKDRYAVDIDTPEIKPRLFGVPRARLATV